MILPPGGESSWGWNQNSMITVDPSTSSVSWNPEFFVMKHFSHFVPQDSTRLGLRGSWTAKSLAFEQPNGQTVIVAANPCSSERLLSVSASGIHFQAELPAASFNSFVLPFPVV